MPAHSFVSDGKSNHYSLRFGPELSFGHSMASANIDRVAIIKYAAGGTSLAVGAGFGNWAWPLQKQ